MAKKAGKLSAGSDLTLKSVRAGKAFSVILAADASANTEKRITDKCNFYNVKLLKSSFDMQTLGHALGKDAVSCVSITDRGFSEALNKSFEQIGKDKNN